MHIPCAASQSVEVLDFETALSLSGQGDRYDRDRSNIVTYWAPGGKTR